MRIKAGISAIMLLCFCLQAHCQNQGNWDRTLDRYELICERCIELLEQKRSGKDVAQESLSSLLTQLSLLKSSLSEADKQMSPAQKMRFEMIRRRFTTIQNGNSDSSDSNSGVRAAEKVTKTAAGRFQIEKTALSASPSPAERHSSPVIPRMSYTFPVSISLAQDQPISAPAPESIERYPTARRISSSNPKGTILAGLQAGVFPTFSLGGFAAFCPQKYGIYLKGRADLSARAPDYSFSLNSDGKIDGGGKVWSDGEQLKKRMAVTAGGIFKVGPVAVYAGAGYGRYRYFMKGPDGQWGLVNDLSIKGLSLDLGLMTGLGNRLFAGIGACVTGFRYSELEITLGLKLGEIK